MENQNKQKAADIAAIKKIFAEFKYVSVYETGFTFEQIKGIFLILCKYWQPTSTEYCCELQNWSLLNTANRAKDWNLQLSNIYISQNSYSKEMCKKKLQQCIDYINNA